MQKNSPLKNVIKVANDMGAWLLIIVVAIFLTITTENFLTTDNILNVLRQTAVTAITALGASFVVLGGEIDLSTGMASTLAGCNAALLMTKMNFGIVPAIIVAVIVGCLCGMITGLIVTYLKITSFMASLAMQYVIQGTILITTNSMPITGLPEGFMVLGRGYIGGFLPVPILIMAIFFMIGAILLKYTIFGRGVMAIGENAEAAKLSGLNVNLTRVSMFVICGFCSAFAGILQASRMSSGQPSSGTDLSMQALAAVYIGGTFKGNMLNTLAGALAWGFVNNGMNLLGVNAYWQKVALGIVILVAVGFDILRAKMSTAKH